jgi:hypothetical protein
MFFQNHQAEFISPFSGLPKALPVHSFLFSIHTIVWLGSSAFLSFTDLPKGKDPV